MKAIQSIRRAVRAITGHSDASTPRVPAIARDAIAASAPYPTLDTPSGPVRVCPARGCLPGTQQYPPPVPQPAVPASKARVERSRLEYFPERHTIEHPRKWEFPSYLDNADVRWLQTLKDMYAMPVSFPASLSPEAGLLIHALVRNIRPRIVVETGTFLGVSTIWMAAALRENGDGGIVHTFDDFTPVQKGPWRDAEIPEGRLDLVAELIARSGVAEHVAIHVGNSSFEIRASHAELRSAGGAQLAFLDADHSSLGVRQDFWATEPILNTGGFIIFHDVFPEYSSHGGPRDIVDNVNQCAVGRYDAIDLYLSPQNYGLSILRRLA